jgi:tetratricopeptide (TPR) repeat protein
LALAVLWALRLALFRRTERLTEHRVWVRGTLAFSAVVLAAAAVGTYARNEVWRNEESLWRDVTIKSPNNGRGQFNYGNMLLVRGDFAGGLPYLERAQALNLDEGQLGRGTQPPVLAVRLAIAYAGVGRDAEAGRHYENAVSLAPDDWEPHFYYGRWLHSTGRIAEAQVQLAAALRANPQSFASRYLLMQMACEQRNWPALDASIAETQELSKGDEVARGYVSKYARLEPGQAPAPEKLVSAASAACGAGRYDECLSNARQALAIRPNEAEAYYVASSALLARGRNADAIHALRMAIRIQPDYAAAKDSLTGVVQ